MPFTFSHPAIILPLRYLPKSWFSITALVIGSLTPDFEYFLRMKVKSDYSHTLYGIFWFDLPLALLLAFLFHNLTRNLLFQNLPAFIRSRILVFTDFNWNIYFKRNWPAVLISLLIGIFSHIFWDAFTHKHGYFVNQITALQNTISIFGTEIPLWKIAQHSSTFIGAVILLIIFFRLPIKFTSPASINKFYWISVILFTAAILFMRFTINPKAFNFGNLVVTFIASFLIATTTIPSIIKFKSIHKN
ncbi:DUF4184 family protein [Flavobacterium nitrogenifigens]|uniref:DUF4184 family protein n=1 Tax=Flavobacterium nitrogenifigens TaxID=1617283 RepID=A0A521EFQ0_9FLAO|nr:DUF4184 family protein [Flavobacterium nitrogenifigens]KAF2326036.1 DUF4184 family protein [Flavobacterium nitrogenifigens]SMO82734.1 protein of unknown function [Flavobacterium nitrogenifigens]